MEAAEPGATGPVAFEEADDCHACGAAFTLFARRHHCRECGRSVCSKHSRKTRPLPHRAISAQCHRVCDGCQLRLAVAAGGGANWDLRSSGDPAAKGLLLSPADARTPVATTVLAGTSDWGTRSSQLSKASAKAPTLDSCSPSSPTTSSVLLDLPLGLLDLLLDEHDVARARRAVLDVPLEDADEMFRKAIFDGMEAALDRGVNMDELVAKSEDLSSSSKLFYKVRLLSALLNSLLPPPKACKKTPLLCTDSREAKSVLLYYVSEVWQPD
jgi:hypothetical protein